MIRDILAPARLHRVPVPHTNEATYALDADGRLWIAKREADMGCEALLAEAIGWLLAKRLGVPIPEGAFDPIERAWLSAYVPNTVHWEPEFCGSLRNPDESGAILTLDLVLFNEARHARNLLAEVVDPQGGVRLWAIDADEALVGQVDDFRHVIDAIPDPRIHARGLPLADLLPGARKAASIASRLVFSDINAIVKEACNLAAEPQGALLADLLHRRCLRAETLLPSYFNRLEGLQ